MLQILALWVGSHSLCLASSIPQLKISTLDNFTYEYLKQQS